MSNFFQRTLTGAVFIIIVLGSVWMGSYTLAGLFFAVNILALNEFYSLLEKNEIRVQKFAGITLGTFLFIIFFLRAVDFLSAGFLVIFPALLFFVFAAELFLNRLNPFSSIANTLLGIIYISLPLSLFITIPFMVSGDGGYESFVLTGYFIILWTSDTAAYLVGSRFGKNRLLQRISPKKSWEGVIGGFIFGLMAAYILSVYYRQWSLPQWIIMATVIIITGIIGDLVESMFKRSFQVKDTGNILPGHGGILDRFDALIFSAPFVFLIAYLFSL